MEIRFRKLPGDRHAIEVRRDRGPDVVRRAAETGQRIPHDLVHAAVETALGRRDGFWGAVAAGVTFDGFEPTKPCRHRRSGTKVLRRQGDDVMTVELAVSWAYRAWDGRALEGRGLPRSSSPLTAEELSRARRALDEALALWQATPEGEELVWVWTVS